MSAPADLSRRERQIMDVLHRQGRATAAQVQAALPDPPGYSGVRALLRILEDKGYVKHQADGARYVYLPRASRETARRSALKQMVSTFFAGSVTQAVAALLDSADARLGEAEWAELKERIDQARNEGR